MSRSWRCLPLAIVVGACAMAPQAFAAPSEVKLEVNDNCVEPNWPCWATPGSNQPAAKVTLASGGSVAFTDHAKEANLVWTGTAPTCEASVPVSPTAAKTGWEGKCAFATPGTYKFESTTMFNELGFDYTKYEVVVESSATTPPPGPTGEGGSTPGTPSTPGESASGSPLTGSPSIHASQKGTSVMGSLQIAKAGAGDRLEVDLLATAASLAKTSHATRVVGRFVSPSVSAGHRSFAVKLNAKARAALKRHHRLALKVKITLTPVHGAPFTVTRSVTLHG
ncbi:MAG TPA: hypothetical protein VGI26_11445 [Solirubrobacteraceae bacterium]